MDLRWVLTSKSLWVETLLQGLLSELNLLSLLELIILSDLSLLVVVFVGLQLDNNVEEVGGLGLQLIRVQGVEVEGLDLDAEGHLHLLVELFLGLGHLLASISDSISTTSSALLLAASLLLLCFEHSLALALGLLHALLLLLSLLGLLLSLLLSDLLLLGLLLLGNLLFLLSSDLLPLGLLLLQSLELLLLLSTLLAPFVDVLLQLLIKLRLLHASLGLGKSLISLLGGVRLSLLLIILVIRHDCVCVCADLSQILPN